MAQADETEHLGRERRRRRRARDRQPVVDRGPRLGHGGRRGAGDARGAGDRAPEEPAYDAPETVVARADEPASEEPEDDAADAPVRLQIRRPLSAAPAASALEGDFVPEHDDAEDSTIFGQLRSHWLNEDGRGRRSSPGRPPRSTAAGTPRRRPKSPTTPTAPRAPVFRYAVRAAAWSPVASHRSPRRSSATPRPFATGSPHTRPACPAAGRLRRHNPSASTTHEETGPA